MPWVLFAFVIVIFLITAHQWNYTVAPTGTAALDVRIQNEVSGSPLRRVGFTLLGVYGLASLVSSRNRRSGKFDLLAWAIVLCVGWAFLSVLWTTAPSLTIRRLVSFAVLGLAAVALGKRLTGDQIAALMCVSTGVFVLVGIAAELRFGVFHPLSAGYRFAGTQHPNNEAVECALLALSGLVVADSDWALRKVGRFGVILGLVMLVLTKSRTSFAAALVAMVAYKGLASKGARRWKVLFVVTLVLMLSVLVLGESAIPILGRGFMLGRGASAGDEATLNGRIWLWMACRGYAGKRPLLGYGFNGFWTPDRIDAIATEQGWTLGSAHSVYVDLVLSLGLIGLGAFVLVVSSAMMKSWRLARKGDGHEYAFFFGFLVFYVLHSALESIFIRPGYSAFLGMVVLSALAFGSSSGRLRKRNHDMSRDSTRFDPGHRGRGSSRATWNARLRSQVARLKGMAGEPERGGLTVFPGVGPLEGSV